MRDGKLTISDSMMFGRVMADGEICRGFLKVVLGIEAGEIRYRNVEQYLDPQVGAKGVRLDAVVKADGRALGIEMQTYREHVLGRRFGYYQSALDADALDKGDDYGLLPESYIVFLCTFDPFSAGEPRYTFEPACREHPGTALQCGTHWVALNASAYARERTASLANLLQYVAEGTVAEGDRLVARIDAVIQDANADERWVSRVLSVMSVEENLAMRMAMATREAREEGRAAGREEGERRLGALVSRLAADGRTSELERLSGDRELLARLYEEYGL